MTIEDAAINFIRARDAWLALKEEHKDLLYENECEVAKSETSEYRKKLAEGIWESEPSGERCHKRGRQDGPGRRLEREYCQACKTTYAFYGKVLEAGRRKASAQGVLTRLVRGMK